MIKIKNLKKNYYGKTVLNIPNFRIFKGEIFGIVGNNGAGKTTFLRLLLDLIKANSGIVRIKELEVHKNETWKNFVGSYLDESFLIDYLTPKEYFYFVGQLYGFSTIEVDSRVRAYQNFFNEEILNQNQYIREFSNGNRKKIGIIGALLIKPEVLLLDEPFASLDPTSQFRLQGMLKNLNNRDNTTIVISSHNIEHISAICSRIAVLKTGNIVREVNASETTLDELKSHFEI